MRDLTTYDTFPFDGPLRRRPLEPAVEEEPPRAGDGGRDCRSCTIAPDETLWHGGNWFLTLHEPSPFRGVVLLSPRTHAESIAELPPARAQELGPMMGTVQRAIERLGGIARVHVNVWGDGGAHLHIWFYPRPYGHLQLRGTFLPVWGLTLPDLPTEEVEAAGQVIAAAMDELTTA